MFVGSYGQQLGLIINPEKARDKYAPDLLNQRSNRLGDLKTQNTPFFTAARYGQDSQYTVVFNVKDRNRYERHYPDIEIYFWVDWQVIKYVSDRGTVEIQPMHGIWYIHFQDLLDVLERAPIHSYQQRKFDTRGNARASYVIDLQHPNFQRIV